MRPVDLMASPASVRWDPRGDDDDDGAVSGTRKGAEMDPSGGRRRRRSSSSESIALGYNHSGAHDTDGSTRRVRVTNHDSSQNNRFPESARKPSRLVSGMLAPAEAVN